MVFWVRLDSRPYEFDRLRRQKAACQIDEPCSTDRSDLQS